jgi:hypothetical protein
MRGFGKATMENGSRLSAIDSSGRGHPLDKFAWRPAPGVRSTSEVYMHIALTNFYLLSVTGPPMPPDIKSNDMGKTVTSKADVIAFLKRSLDAVKTARAQVKPGDLQRKVKIMNKDATVDGMYLQRRKNRERR